MSEWTTLAPVVGASFLASAVEVVEAFTIVLAVATVRGWRPALTGAALALAALAVLAFALGPMVGRLPIHGFQLVIGVLVLVFGMSWLRKAALRAAGIIPLHDEAAIFASGKASLRADRHEERQDWIAGLTAFKAVLLEGIEVVFIVVAFGSRPGGFAYAAAGALIACALVLAVGFAIRRPLAQVPENTLKFCVGVMLSAFGIFWTGEGLGIEWPGGDLALLGLAAILFITALGAVRLARLESLEVHP